jgi:hypothetical protein
MIEKLNKQIGLINESIAWIKKHKPESYNQKFIQLVNCRKTLKRIIAAESDNPGIAAFGKSQVGKSYLISCLLQDNGKPFMVEAEGQSYNFVFKINPPSEEGGGRESTGVVSRFSSFKRSPDAYSSDYPVLVKTFSLTDIITILADSYYSDFASPDQMGEAEIEELNKRIADTYNGRSPISKPVITADDVLNMRDYFEKHLNAYNLNKSSFFDSLALNIEKVPTSEYVDIFSNLWRNDPNFTRLYQKLYDILNTFNFANYIYLPINAVLHEEVRENTIMSVQCLKQLFDNAGNSYLTDAYVKEDGKFIKMGASMPKSHICAICSEVVFKIEESFLSSKSSYDLTNVKDDVKPRLNHSEIEMQMLRDNDLLDFPGARSREEEDISKLDKDSVLLNCFLRGKVAYLFNKYNEEMGINILLYCHHNKDNDVTSLYRLLEQWVNNYVGDTPEKRRRKLEATKVSPLFYIGTMFNLDMTLGVGATPTYEGIDQRWKGRLDTVMNSQCFHRNTVDWMRNWTRPGEDFKNSYMLRDYKFSGPKAGLYEGFNETHREQRMIMSEDYYNLMRKTFVENEFVKQYFADPALSWDVAASINNDGALYIMENLNEVAKRMGDAREQQFNEMAGESTNKVRTIMQEYQMSEDVDVILQQNIRKANSIIREMDFTCNDDNYFFGHLLQALQVNETDCLKKVHFLIQSGELGEKNYNFKNYEIIRKRCDEFKSCKDTDACWELLVKKYALLDRNDAENYLKNKKIEPSVLFSGSFRKKLNSCLIADQVYEQWKKHLSSTEFMNTVLNNKQFDHGVMEILTDNIKAISDMLKLNDIMAEAIAEYVNVIHIYNINESLVADILASTINRFIIDLGYELTTESDKQNARKVAMQEDLPVFDYIDKEATSTFEEDELTALFDELTDNPKAMTTSFEDNYYTWLEYMVVSFIAHVKVPDFDREANHKLTEIINNIA